jgi:thiaminase
MSEQSFGPFDSNLIRQAGQLWEKATHSPFLEGICDGTLSKEVFNRWLVQDYHFVTAFLRFVPQGAPPASLKTR